MIWRVPVADLALTEEDAQAVARCLREGRLGTGSVTGDFERAVADWSGARHAVAVASGTAALHVACLALGLRPGDEVIVPALTFLASASAPRYVGARPVLCDVASPTAPNADLATVERCLTPRTRAVMAVHLWGYPAPLAGLRGLCEEAGIPLIEDAAQAIGAVTDTGRQAGTVGRAGCLSLFSKKQLAVGEGGMLLTDDDAVAGRARKLRGHDPAGCDCPLDDPRSALGLSRLERLEADIEHRREVARAYRRRLGGLPGLSLMWSDEEVEPSSHFAFGVLFESGALREAVRTELAAHGIQTTRYPVLHELTAYRSYARPGSLPSAEAAAERHLVLPLSSHLSLEDVELVCAAMRDALHAAQAGAPAPLISVSS